MMWWYIHVQGQWCWLHQCYWTKRPSYHLDFLLKDSENYHIHSPWGLWSIHESQTSYSFKFYSWCPAYHVLWAILWVETKIIKYMIWPYVWSKSTRQTTTLCGLWLERAEMADEGQTVSTLAGGTKRVADGWRRSSGLELVDEVGDGNQGGWIMSWFFRRELERAADGQKSSDMDRVGQRGSVRAKYDRILNEMSDERLQLAGGARRGSKSCRRWPDKVGDSRRWGD